MRLFRKAALVLFIITTSAAVFPQTASSPSELISSALRAGDFDKAIELSQSALKQSPNNAQLWTLQAIALTKKGEDKKALAAFEQALKVSPDNIAALEGAAQIEYQVGSNAGIPTLNHL